MYVPTLRPCQVLASFSRVSQGIARAWLVFFAVSAFTVGLIGRDAFAEEPDEYEDYAEVFVDRYFGPDDKLDLKDAGEQRAEALAHFSRGLSFESKKDFERAIEAYREVLGIIPGEVNLARKVAYLLAQSGQREEGRKILETAHQKNPDTPRSAIILSEYLATFHADEDGAREEAMRLAEDAVKQFPSSPAAWEHLVRMQLVARQGDEARATVMRAMERDETNPRFWIRLGRVAQRIWPLNPEEQAPGVINGIFEKALERAGNDASIREQVGDYYHDAQQPEKALEVFLSLVEDFPDRLELREKLARVYGALGEEDKVIETLAGIVEIDPQNAEIHRELGSLFLSQKNYGKATEHFRQAMRLTTGTVDEYEAIGKMMIFGAEMAEDAVSFLERGAYLHPEDSRLPYLLTFAMAKLGKFEKAVSWFEKTVELASQSQPDLLDAVFYYRFGASVEQAGDIERASKLFRTSMEQIAKMNGDDEETLELRALVYNYLGYMWLENDMNIDEAGELIKEALAAEPDSGAITDSLGWFYFKKGEYEKALAELKKAEQMVEEPDSVIYDHLGQASFKMGDRKKAVEYLKRAVELDPESDEFRKRLEEYESAVDAAPEPEQPKPAPDEKLPDAA